MFQLRKSHYYIASKPQVIFSPKIIIKKKPLWLTFYSGDRDGFFKYSCIDKTIQFKVTARAEERKKEEVTKGKEDLKEEKKALITTWVFISIKTIYQDITRIAGSVRGLMNIKIYSI